MIHHNCPRADCQVSEQDAKRLAALSERDLIGEPPTRADADAAGVTLYDARTAYAASSESHLRFWEYQRRIADGEIEMLFGV